MTGRNNRPPRHLTLDEAKAIFGDEIPRDLARRRAGESMEEYRPWRDAVRRATDKVREIVRTERIEVPIEVDSPETLAALRRTEADLERAKGELDRASARQVAPRYQFQTEFLVAEQAEGETLEQVDARLTEEYGLLEVKRTLGLTSLEELRRRKLNEMLYKFKG